SGLRGRRGQAARHLPPPLPRQQLPRLRRQAAVRAVGQGRRPPPRHRRRLLQQHRRQGILQEPRQDGADAGEHPHRRGVQGRPRHPRLGAHERAPLRRRAHRRHGAGVGGGDGAVREVRGRRAPGDGGAGGLLRRGRAREQGPQPLAHLLRHQLRGDAPRARGGLRHHPPVPG
ncbi:hypothetical protein ACJX0J_010664, partial [Zea mays]